MESDTTSTAYPEYTYKALARVLLPKIKQDFDSEEWQRGFEEYKEVLKCKSV